MVKFLQSIIATSFSWERVSIIQVTINNVDVDIGKSDSYVVVIVVTPEDTPVARPFESIVAVFVYSLVHNN